MPAGVACAVDTDGLDAWRVQAVAAEETVHDRSRQLEAQIKEVEGEEGEAHAVYVPPVLCTPPGVFFAIYGAVLTSSPPAQKSCALCPYCCLLNQGVCMRAWLASAELPPPAQCCVAP